MSLKTIFQEGMKERRRRKSLGKKGNEFKEKEKSLAERLTALGEKAWESKTDISAFADLRSTLGEAQKTLDELKVQAEQIQKQQREAEEKKKQENERLAAAMKEAEEKKRDLEGRLNEQKNTLQAGQKQAQDARDRLAAVSRERGQLEGKAAGTEAGEAEKAEIAKGIGLLDQETAALQAKIGSSEEAGKPIAALVASLQDGITQAKKQIEALRQEQKQVISELDKKLSALKNDLAKNGEKVREADVQRKQNYRALGEKLVQSGTVDPSLAAEMAAATAARSEMEGVQAMIGGLERQKDEGQVNAYKKMLTILIGGIVLLAALVVILFLLLSPKKADPAIAGLEPEQAKALQQIMKMAERAQKGGEKQAGQIKAAAVVSETGKAIIDEILTTFDQCVAEAAALAGARPEASVLLPQLEKLYAGYGEKMAALNSRFLALRDQDIFAFRQANGYMSQNRPQHVSAKDNALSQSIAYYNFEKGEQEVVDMLSRKIVKLIDQAVQQ
jgi:DNA-binding ferritin-like protein